MMQCISQPQSQSRVEEWAAEGRWQEVLEEKRAVLASMMQARGGRNRLLHVAVHWAALHLRVAFECCAGFHTAAAQMNSFWLAKEGWCF